MSGEAQHAFVHASAVIVAQWGVLIEGPSGSGKSSLAWALIAAAGVSSRCGLLVGDDRLGLSVSAGRLLARPHPALAGLLERRGIGLVRVEHEPACVLHVAVRLRRVADPRPPRLPDQPPTLQHLGVSLPRVDIDPGAGAFEAAQAILARLPRCGRGGFEGLQSAC